MQILFGNSLIPMVILGDRGFLKKYGSTLTDEEIRTCMFHAVLNEKLGIAAGDLRTLQIASSISKATVIYHVYLPIVKEGSNEIGFSYLTLLHDYLNAWSPSFVNSDPIVGYTYRNFSRYKVQNPYSSKFTLKFDENVIYSELDIVRKYEPSLITLGGDFFDLCMILNRFDLIETILLLFKDVCKETNTAIGLITYIGALFLDKARIQRIINKIDTVVIPVNYLGAGMVPNRNSVLNWARSFSKPILGIHCLALNNITLANAFKYSFTDAKINGVLIGCSTIDHIKELGREKRIYFNESI